MNKRNCFRRTEINFLLTLLVLCIFTTTFSILITFFIIPLGYNHLSPSMTNDDFIFTVLILQIIISITLYLRCRFRPFRTPRLTKPTLLLNILYLFLFIFVVISKLLIQSTNNFYLAIVVSISLISGLTIALKNFLSRIIKGE